MPGQWEAFVWDDILKRKHTRSNQEAHAPCETREYFEKTFRKRKLYKTNILKSSFTKCGI